ncbi:MAG: hypothetical protein H6618_07440 [Deltaproteobacteria bacterium]|nr:hypothetical protein [Deltaproteobacteria bacterium]
MTTESSDFYFNINKVKYSRRLCRKMLQALCLVLMFSYAPEITYASEKPPSDSDTTEEANTSEKQKTTKKLDGVVHLPPQPYKNISDFSAATAQSLVNDSMKAMIEKNPTTTLGAAAGFMAGSFIAPQLCGTLGFKEGTRSAFCHGMVSILPAMGGAALAFGPARLLHKAKWWAKGLFGHAEPPEGLVQIHPKSAQHPDGALQYSELIFDPDDAASLQIKSSIRSMQRRQPLRNAIYFGDAGTGKSSAVQSFAYIKGYEVWSITAAKMDLDTFKQLTRWLQKTSSKNRKILVDVSEGDDILYNIALKEEFRNFFKNQYKSEQENYALIFSCNFSNKVGAALKIITDTEELARRFSDRIRFSVPGPAVRYKILKRSLERNVLKFHDVYPDDHELAYFNQSSIADFFKNSILKNKEFITEDLIPATEGMSHDQMNILGAKLPDIYLVASRERQLYLMSQQQAEEADSEYSFIIGDRTQDSISSHSPLDRIRLYLNNKRSEPEWIDAKQRELVERSMRDIEASLPLLRLQAEKQRLILEARQTSKPANPAPSGQNSGMKTEASVAE